MSELEAGRVSVEVINAGQWRPRGHTALAEDEAFLIAYDPETAAWYAHHGLTTLGWDTLVKLCERTMRLLWDTFCPDDGRPAAALRACRVYQATDWGPGARAALDAVLPPLMESWALAFAASQDYQRAGPTRASDYVLAVQQLVLMQLWAGQYVAQCREVAIRALASALKTA